MVITNITILITAPILGAVSDINKSTKNILVFFTLTSIFFTSLLFFLDSGLWIFALIFYGIANYSFSVSQIPYDKILTQVTTPDKYSIVSNQGYAWGYLGGGTLFLINALMSLSLIHI